MSSLEKLVAVAMGRDRADLLLKEARVVNVFTGEVIQTNVVIVEDTIAGVGDEYVEAQEIVDLQGQHLAPGLIDAHIHVESSMLTPAAFARAALLDGTTTVICDPHEIVNVAGLAGLEYMARAAAKTPLDFQIMIPSCIPATFLETTGAAWDADATWEAFKRIPTSPGLAEMMNYPGVLEADPGVLARLNIARGTDRLVDGHAPLLKEPALNAYAAVGIGTDHEATTPQEALERIRLGVKVIIREGSAAQDLDSILPVVNRDNKSEFMFGCDDLHPGHLLGEGEITPILRKAAAAGLDPVTAIQLATINPARHYRLKARGAVAPGYRADLVVFHDLKDFKVMEVYKNGERVVKDGSLLKTFETHRDHRLERSVILPDLQGVFSINPPGPTAFANVIAVKPGTIITGWEQVSAGDCTREHDILRVAVLERYGKGGSVGLGLVRGFGLQRGALASTVAHDSHNLVVVGAEERSMETAARHLAKIGGGIVVAEEARVVAELPLPVGGIMSYDDAAAVAGQHSRLQERATRLGCRLPAPFMQMSFLTLAVIPALKITDKGLIDVQRTCRVPLWQRS